MNEKNQIEIINSFFENDLTNLLINQITESVFCFYLFVIKYFATKHDMRISVLNNNLLPEKPNVDLFSKASIDVYTLNSSKQLEKKLSESNKKIIFTDYKYFKKFKSKANSVNAYRFKNDIDTFVKNELNINNKNLISLCAQEPAMIFSETSKYNVNGENYISSLMLLDVNQNIVNIRRSINIYDKTNIDIKDFYRMIKNESKFKKFSFLTY